MIVYAMEFAVGFWPILFIAAMQEFFKHNRQ